VLAAAPDPVSSGAVGALRRNRPVSSPHDGEEVDVHAGPPGDELPSYRRPISDAEPVVAQALTVISRALDEMGSRDTRPLLDPPPRPYRLRPLAGTSLAFFPVVLSAAAFGTEVPHEQAGRVLAAYLASGGNAVDIADTGDDESLGAVGAVLNGSGARDRVLLSARVGVHPRAPGLSAARLTAAVDRLLTVLRTDRIELLAFARHDRTAPVEETFTAAQALVEAGKVRHLAADEHSGDRLIEARVLAGQRSLPFLAAVRPVYNLVDREAYERQVAPVASAQGLGVFPRSPLAGGALAARPGRRRGEDRQRPLPRRSQRIVSVVQDIAVERRVPPASVALAWLATKPSVVASVVSATTPEEVAAVVGVTSVHLTRAEAGALDRVSSA
jgi:aryl-alcohol dehydrogenase-like predicted oxidoreductase